MSKLLKREDGIEEFVNPALCHKAPFWSRMSCINDAAQQSGTRCITEGHRSRCNVTAHAPPRRSPRHCDGPRRSAPNAQRRRAGGPGVALPGHVATLRSPERPGTCPCTGGASVPVSLHLTSTRQLTH